MELTCIIVTIDCLAFDSSVSPQTPSTFLSCIMLEKVVSVYPES